MIFRWARDQLGTSEIELAKRLGKDPYEVLTEIAAKVNPGSDGLLFHPYLAGERAPLWNANARGSSLDSDCIIRKNILSVLF